jgi:serine/threonine-protein kinase
VFRGKQIATGREVALKILHPHNVHDETIVARFRRERRRARSCATQHTVTTYDFDETPTGILYLAMELLRGRSAAPPAEGRRAAGRRRVLRIMDQVAASLSEAHANGIVTAT